MKYDYRLRRLEEQSAVFSETIDVIMNGLSDAEIMTLLRDGYDQHFEQFKQSDPDKAARYADLCDWMSIKISRIPEDCRPTEARMVEIVQKLENAPDAEMRQPLRDNERGELERSIVESSNEAHFELVFLDHLDELDPPSVTENLLAGKILEFQDDEGAPIVFCYLGQASGNFQNLYVKSSFFAERHHRIQEGNRPHRDFTEEHVRDLWHSACQTAFYSSEGWPTDRIRQPYSPFTSVISEPTKREISAPKSLSKPPSVRTNGGALRQ